MQQNPGARPKKNNILFSVDWVKLVLLLSPASTGTRSDFPLDATT